MTTAASALHRTPVMTTSTFHAAPNKKEECKQGPVTRIFNAALDYLKGSDGVKNTAKICYHVVDWMKQFGPISSEAQKFRNVTSDIKNGISFTEVFGYTNTFVKNLAGLTKVSSSKDMPAAVRDTFLSGVRIVSPVCDGVTLANQKKIVHLSPETMHGVKTASYSALAVGTGAETIFSINKVREGVKKVNESKTYSDRAHNQTHLISKMIDLAKFTSYFAMGILGVLSATLGYILAPYAILACSTSALLFTVGGYFYNRLNGVSSKG